MANFLGIVRLNYYVYLLSLQNNYYLFMKSLRKILRISSLSILSATSLISCVGEDENVVTVPEAKNKFFIAATAGTGTYLLTPDSLTGGTTTVVGNGVELPRTYTAWVMNGSKAAVGLYYAQGDPGVGVSFGLNTTGQLAPVGNEFQIASRFTSYGPFSNYVITSVGSVALASGKVGSTFNFIDLNNSNAISQKEIITENFTGNGGTATFSGVVDFGNGEFLTGVVLNQAGATATVHQDSVWVAAFDENLTLKRIYRDNRISYASGRFRSQYYSQIAKDASDNVYVFSGSYDAKTTKPAGALRINKNATSFDNAYYFNIQEAAGGYKFRRVWPISEDYFLLEFYNDFTITTSTAATQYAIVKMTDKTVKWLTTGFPAKDQITAIGIPFADNGKLYFPITTATAPPTVYVIDPKTATAKAGLVINADGVGAVGKLAY